MKARSFRGFTLLELLVVIAIIGILSAVVLSSVNAARQKARIGKARAEINQIQTAIGELASDTGVWPGGKAVDGIETGASNEIWDLNTPAAGITASDGTYDRWNGPYFTKVPLDPWGNNYFLDTDYQITPAGLPCAGAGGCITAVVIGSFGPNGVGQNVYDADDIIYVLAR